MSDNIYITVAGMEVPYRPLSFTVIELAGEGIRKEYAARGESLEAPTREVEVLGGEKLEVPLDENTLVAADDEAETARRQVAWVNYQDTTKRIEKEILETQELILFDAILLDLPSDTAWIEKQKRRHINVPVDDPDKLRAHWIKTEVLLSIEDLQEITARITLSAATREVTPERLAAARKPFRDKLQTFFERFGYADTAGGTQEPEQER